MALRRLSRVLEKVPELANVTPVQHGNGGGSGDRSGTDGHQHKKGNLGTLASYLKKKNATDNQRRQFLATAAYLHDKTGDRRLTTSQVKKALSTNNQGKLTNASASLNDNVGRGFCEKDGKLSS